MPLYYRNCVPTIQFEQRFKGVKFGDLIVFYNTARQIECTGSISFVDRQTILTYRIVTVYLRFTMNQKNL